MGKGIKCFIERVARYNAEVLKIDKPEIRYVKGLLMGTPTTKAETSSTGKEIKIRRRDYVLL